MATHISKEKAIQVKLMYSNKDEHDKINSDYNYHHLLLEGEENLTNITSGKVVPIRMKYRTVDYTSIVFDMIANTDANNDFIIALQAMLDGINRDKDLEEGIISCICTIQVSEDLEPKLKNIYGNLCIQIDAWHEYYNSISDNIIIGVSFEWDPIHIELCDHTGKVVSAISSPCVLPMLYIVTNEDSNFNYKVLLNSKNNKTELRIVKLRDMTEMLNKYEREVETEDNNTLIKDNNGSKDIPYYRLEISCPNESVMLNIRDTIHEKLVGNQKYIDSDICLFTSQDVIEDVDGLDKPQIQGKYVVVLSVYDKILIPNISIPIKVCEDKDNTDAFLYSIQLSCKDKCVFEEEFNKIIKCLDCRYEVYTHNDIGAKAIMFNSHENYCQISGKYAAAINIYTSVMNEDSSINIGGIIAGEADWSFKINNFNNIHIDTIKSILSQHYMSIYTLSEERNNNYTIEEYKGSIYVYLYDGDDLGILSDTSIELLSMLYLLNNGSCSCEIEVRFHIKHSTDILKLINKITDNALYIINNRRRCKYALRENTTNKLILNCVDLDKKVYL